MGTYGHVRTTGDLDVFVNATQANAKKMMQACAAYGIDLNDLILLKHAAVKGRNKARDSEDLSFLQKLKAALSQRGKS